MTFATSRLCSPECFNFRSNNSLYESHGWSYKFKKKQANKDLTFEEILLFQNFSMGKSIHDVNAGADASVELHVHNIHTLYVTGSGKREQATIFVI